MYFHIIYLCISLSWVLLHLAVLFTGHVMLSCYQFIRHCHEAKASASHKPRFNPPFFVKMSCTK